MKYKEFTIETTAEAEDLISEIFLRYTDFGVSISSSEDVTELMLERAESFDYIDDDLIKPDGKSFVKGCFPLETADDDFKTVLNDIETLKENGKGIVDLGTLTVSERVFENDDWIDNWRKSFKPIEFGKVCVVPSWLEYSGSRIPVTIGTDLAFGTGEHETTSLCIDMLEKNIFGGETVFDVGTGSGILGIVAAKLGAEKVYMTDNDPLAVHAAETNVSDNGVDGVCYPILSNLADDLVGVADVVVANITAEILIVLSESINNYLKENGLLLLSGILNDRLDKVRSAYMEKGFEIIETFSKGEWSALVARKLRIS